MLTAGRRLFSVQCPTADPKLAHVPLQVAPQPLDRLLLLQIPHVAMPAPMNIGFNLQRPKIKCFIPNKSCSLSQLSYSPSLRVFKPKCCSYSGMPTPTKAYEILPFVKNSGPGTGKQSNMLSFLIGLKTRLASKPWRRSSGNKSKRSTQTSQAAHQPAALRLYQCVVWQFQAERLP